MPITLPPATSQTSDFSDDMFLQSEIDRDSPATSTEFRQQRNDTSAENTPDQQQLD